MHDNVDYAHHIGIQLHTQYICVESCVLGTHILHTHFTYISILTNILKSICTLECHLLHLSLAITIVAIIIAITMSAIITTTITTIRQRIHAIRQTIHAFHSFYEY